MEDEREYEYEVRCLRCGNILEHSAYMCNFCGNYNLVKVYPPNAAVDARGFYMSKVKKHEVN